MCLGRLKRDIVDTAPLWWLLRWLPAAYGTVSNDVSVGGDQAVGALASSRISLAAASASYQPFMNSTS
jgi:hypothetical protein